MDETEDFLGSVLPRLTQADTALHNGDAGPRIAIWSHEDPLTVFGAVRTVSGWAEIHPLFEWLASQFSNGKYQYEVIAAGASGDLGYVVGIEHSTASVGGAPPRTTNSESRRYFGAKTANGRSSIGTPIRCPTATPPVAKQNGSSRHSQNPMPGDRPWHTHPCVGRLRGSQSWRCRL